MAGKAGTAWLLMAMMVFMVAAPAPVALEEAANPMRVAASSDMIADFAFTVAGGAHVVDVAHIGQTYVVALTHTGAGSVGSYVWSNQAAGGLLLAFAHNGSVVHDAFTTYAPRAMKASSDMVVVLANGSSTGLMTQVFNEQLALQEEQTFTSFTTGGTPEDLIFYNLDLDGTDAYLVVGCPASSGELLLFSVTCTTSTGRMSITTLSWDTVGNTTQMVTMAKWFTIGTTTMYHHPTQNGGGTSTVGPNPVCTQAIYAHNGTLDSIANAHCSGRKASNAEQAHSLFGTSSSWTTNGASNSLELSMGMAFSTYDTSTSNDNFDGDLLAFNSCNSGIDIEVEINHFGSHSALFIAGWIGGGNQECSLIEHEAADAGDTSREITTFK